MVLEHGKKSVIFQTSLTITQTIPAGVLYREQCLNSSGASFHRGLATIIPISRDPWCTNLSAKRNNLPHMFNFGIFLI